MKVRRRSCDVSQARHFEYHIIRWILGDLASAMIRLIRPGDEDTELFEHRPANIGTRVTDHAAQIGE